MCEAPDSGLSDGRRAALAAHFDPRWGSRYWLERLRACGFQAGHEFNSLQELRALGVMSERDLSERSVEDFIPRSLQDLNPCFVRSETGGATGASKRTVFSPEEFESSFVTPFVRAADAVLFPRGGCWLYVGPSGPHIIGRAAMALARARGASEPFTVDFDPRWYRKLSVGSTARERYLRHLVEQALAILDHEPVDVLFATPAVLETLAPRMAPAQRERIRGLHYGGMHLDHGAYRIFREHWFPHAVHLSGYGNSLFGCCLEVPMDSSRQRIDYYLPHDAWAIELVDWPSSSGAFQDLRTIELGQRGRVLAHRFSPNFLILNLLERDCATRIDAGELARACGFVHGALADPEPAALENAVVEKGIY